jgi:uncharacterized repeat protein (TIGR04076 family)
MTGCKITVLKRELYQDLVDDFAGDRDTPCCERFQEGQEFTVENPWRLPEGFCAWAWADIRQYVMAAYFEGGPPTPENADPFIACCTDGYRPVIFKVESIQ